MPLQKLTFGGQRCVVLPEDEYNRLAGEPPEPLSRIETRRPPAERSHDRTD